MSPPEPKPSRWSVGRPDAVLLCRMAGAGGRKKVFRLADVVQPLSDSQIGSLSSRAVKRILHSEKAVTQSGMSHVRAEGGPVQSGQVHLEKWF